jgi:biopolymer transport protein ExbB
MTISELFLKGGPVVFILALYSVAALAILVERLLAFAAMNNPPVDMADRLKKAADARRPVPELTGPEGIVANAALTALAEGADPTIAAQRVGSEQMARMERGFRTLSFLGATAPLLGLLGTVLGMIEAFMVIEAAGGKVDAQALAGGIWEALLTTGVGLAVSLPTLMILHTLEGYAERRGARMRRFASLVVERAGARPLPEPDRGV